MSQIGSTQPASLSSVSRQPESSQDGFGQLNTSEFMDIIFSELQNQDPLAPNDTQALLEQLSSIQSIQSDIDLADRMEAIASQGQLTEASSMIGMFVSGLDETNERVLDWVGSVSRTDEGVVLNLNGGQRVPIENVDEVLNGDDARTLLEELVGDDAADETDEQDGAETTP